jgi:hypothetical protein
LTSNSQLPPSPSYVCLKSLQTLLSAAYAFLPSIIRLTLVKLIQHSPES